VPPAVAGAAAVHEGFRVRTSRNAKTAAAAVAAVLVVVLVVVVAVVLRPSGAPPRQTAQSAPVGVATPRSGITPVAATDWQAGQPPKGTRIEGFADRAGVLPGQPVQLRVSATGASFDVTAYRMGSYGAAEAGRVWHGGPFPVVAQPAATEIAATRTITTAWEPTATVATTNWPAGHYLLRLEGSDGGRSYVPLTLRSANTTGRVVLVAAVTDWQAYNDWGGLSLYHGRDGRPVSRSYAVSFDRPYAEEQGAGDFLGNELPLVTFAERLGIPLAYATDIDLHDQPHLLDGARAVVSPGHDEYYSTAMRQTLTSARDAGTNVLFLGANAVYRHIRLSPTAVGDNRLETDYKDAALDPLTTTDPAESTSQWRSPPVPRPESALVGGFYQCNPAQANLVVAPRLTWLTEGIGLQPGQVLGSLVGPEYDRVDLSVTTPHPIEVLFHSPVTCTPGGGPRHDAADVTYYTTPSGAGVFDSGTSKWECALSDTACGPGWGNPATFDVVRQITTRLLTAAAAGPLGRAHPAVDTTGGAPGPDDGIAGIAAPRAGGTPAR
jgi:hypothetical protein